MNKENGWKTLEGVHINNIYDAIRETYDFMDKKGGFILAFLGTDSQNIGQKFTSFVQCVALHMVDSNGIGKGGRVYYIRHLESRHHNRQKRLLREAELSIKLGQKLEPLLNELDIPFEIHADVNSHAGDRKQNKSYDVHDAVKGWIESQLNVPCIMKPNAWLASIVCDKHTRSVKHYRKR